MIIASLNFILVLSLAMPTLAPFVVALHVVRELTFGLVSGDVKGIIDKLMQLTEIPEELED